MQEMLSEFWRGNLSPMDKCGVKNEELSKLYELCEKNREKLSKSLSEEGKETMKAYNGNMDEISFLYSEEAFIRGFCFGMKFAIESLTE